MGRQNRRSSTGEKRWVELHSPLLTLLEETEQFLREAEQEVLNRREKVGTAPQSPAHPLKGAEQFLREVEQFLREAEQFFREVEQFLREAEHFLREGEQFLS